MIPVDTVSMDIWYNRVIPERNEYTVVTHD